LPRTETAPAERPAALFAALGDEKRLLLVDRLCTGGPMSITRLSDGTSISRQAVTKHLHRLEAAGIVRSHRAGRERFWEIEPPRLDDARRYLELISARWDAAAQRLRRFVED
jgi:DNA-binding transcriptional ArsR family regulator